MSGGKPHSDNLAQANLMEALGKEIPLRADLKTGQENERSARPTQE
jgi:hypothetical protein